MNESSYCYTSSPAFGAVSVLGFGHSNRCLVVSLCFHLQLPNDTILNIFSYTYLSSVYILWWGVCSGIFPIFQLGCSFSYCWVLRVLYEFWIIVLRHVFWKYQYFLPVCCLVFWLFWLLLLIHSYILCSNIFISI